MIAKKLVIIQHLCRRVDSFRLSVRSFVFPSVMWNCVNILRQNF